MRHLGDLVEASAIVPQYLALVPIGQRQREERLQRLRVARIAVEDFDAILGRLVAEDLKYGTSTREMNMQWNELHGGRRIFFADRNGHSYELMTAASPPGLG